MNSKSHVATITNLSSTKLVTPRGILLYMYGGYIHIVILTVAVGEDDR